MLGDNTAKQARPRQEVLAEVLSASRAKSEHEWVAANEIQRLQKELAGLKTLAIEFDGAWSLIMRADGDRDEDNKSALTVEQTCAVAALCRYAAKVLDPETLR